MLSDRHPAKPARLTQNGPRVTFLHSCSSTKIRAFDGFGSHLQLEEPAVHGLMKIQRTRYGRVCLHILEASSLQGSIWTDIECVWFTEQLIDLQRSKIEIDALRLSVAAIENVERPAACIASNRWSSSALQGLFNLTANSSSLP